MLFQTRIFIVLTVVFLDLIVNSLDNADASAVVCGYSVADKSESQVRGVESLESPGATLAVVDATTRMARWKAGPISPAPDVTLPPEPTDEFRPLADDFHMTPFAMVPFRAALSVAASRDAGRAACTEYGGYARIGHERIHPNWSPRHPLWLCPRQQGTLRVFGAKGEEVVRVALPEPGLCDVHLSPDGSLAWCVPMNWFARGLAGCPWLPTDDKANRVHVSSGLRTASVRSILRKPVDLQGCCGYSADSYFRSFCEHTYCDQCSSYCRKPS